MQCIILTRALQLQDRIHFLPELVNDMPFVWQQPLLDFDPEMLQRETGSPGQ